MLYKSATPMRLNNDKMFGNKKIKRNLLHFFPLLGG